MPKSKHRSRKQNKPKPVKWKSDKGLFQIPARPRPTVEFPRPEINSKMEFTFVPGFPQDTPQSKILRSPLGGHSSYDIRYFLSIPGVDVFKDKIDFEKFKDSGNTLLQLPIGEHLVIKVKDEIAESEIQFLGNNKGILSQVRLRVECDSFEEAKRFSHERVAMILSYWSFLFDTTIEMSDYLIIEEKTGTRIYSVGLIGRVKPFSDDSAFTLPPEHQRVLAAYRDAMNSSNLFYQLLCFFKVTEGIISLRRNKIKKTRPLRKGEQGFELNEKFPEDVSLIPFEDDIKNVFQPFLGKTFQEVREILKDSFRDAIAHLIKFNSVLDSDRYDDVTKCAKAIPVLKYMARTMLANDLSKLSNTS